MCYTLGSVKKNQNHIFQKWHTKKDLRKSAFSNTLSRNLFKWIQDLIQNCVEIILSAHPSFRNNFLIVFFSLFEKMFWIFVCFLGWLAELKFEVQEQMLGLFTSSVQFEWNYYWVWTLLCRGKNYMKSKLHLINFI